MNQTLDLQDEDRLPWLEPVEDEEPEGISPLKLLGFIIVGLIILGVVLGGVYALNQNRAVPDGQGELIAAQPGAYKEKATPADAADRKFAGAGDATYSASQGGDPAGQIDAARVPEAPIAAPTTAAPARPVVAAPSQTVTVRVAPAAPAAGAPKGPAATAGGTSIQLGAYGSDSGARDAWAKLAKRFPYLAPLTNSIEKAEVGSATLYRLRARTASGAEANQLCGKLKVAGENCIVVN